MNKLQPETITLVCIDGKDAFFKMVIKPGGSVSLGHADNDPGMVIQELSREQGLVVFSNKEGRISIDASNCSVEIKLNGAHVSRSVIGPNDILRIGQSTWKITYS